MFKKIFETVKNFLFVSVSDRNKAEFELGINRINASRAKITAITFVVIELMVLTAACIIKKGNLFRKPDIYYGIMYVIFLAVMSAYSLIFTRLGKNVDSHGISIRIAGITFTGFALLWCAGISLLDQLSNGQVIVYSIAILAIAVCPFFRPVTFLIMYLSVHMVFITAMPYFQKSDTALYANYINSTAFLMISWAIAYMRYKKQVEDFKNKKIIQKQSDELQNVNKKLKELSQTDSLTGVFNRLVFDSTIEAEWNRSMSSNTLLSLIMIDIDFFKEYNDNYGHQLGDDCLKKIAAILSACAKRSTDTVTRYGGDEFAIIIPCTGKEDVLALAEKMRRMVFETATPHEYSSISDRVTISLGVNTIYPTGESSLEDFIRTADKALYKAKINHNCIALP